MNKVLTEEKMTPEQVAGLLGVSSATVRRWISDGLGTARLGGCRVGGRIWTSRAALGRFLEQLNSRSDGPAGELCADQGDAPADSATTMELNIPATAAELTEFADHLADAGAE